MVTRRGTGWGTLGAGRAAEVGGAGRLGARGAGRGRSDSEILLRRPKKGRGERVGQGAARARVRPRRPLLPLAASPAPLPPGRGVYLRIGVCGRVGPRLPCWSLGRRCFRAKAAGPQWVRRPGSVSAELTTLGARLGRSESSGGSSGPEGRSSSLLWLLPVPSPPTPDSQPFARGEPTPSLGLEAPPPAPFPPPQSLFATKGSEDRAAKREGTGAGAGARGEGGRQAGRLAGAERRKGSGPGWASRDAPGRPGRGGGRAGRSALRREGPRGMEPKPPAAAET